MNRETAFFFVVKRDPYPPFPTPFHMVVTIVKIESRSFTSAEIPNILELKIPVIMTIENTYDLYVVYRYKLL